MSNEQDNVISIATNKRKAADVLPFVDTYIARKEQEIKEILALVDRYEKRRIAEERHIRNMTGLRKMFAPKKPDTHLAVEYIHFVKKPLEKVRILEQEVATARAIVGAQPSQIVEVSYDMERALVQ